MNINQPGVFQQGDDILIFADGKTETFNRNSFPKWNELEAAVHLEDWAAIPAILESAKDALQNFLAADGTKVKFTNDDILLDGNPLPNGLTNLLMRMWGEGKPMQPYVELLARLDKNPAPRVFDEFMNWIDKADLSITPDGYVWAYRAVKVHQGETFTDLEGREVRKGDFVDKYTSTIRNNVGDVVTMKRRLVDENSRVDCSHGLHFANLRYAQNSYGAGGDPLLLVKIDPADVVAIPSAYNHEKGRCCRYEIVKVWREPGSYDSVNALADVVVDESELGGEIAPNEGYRWGVKDSETGVILSRHRTRALAYEELYAQRRNGNTVSLYDAES